MRELSTKIAKGEDFLRDPRLAASGVLVDVGEALYLGQHRVAKVLQVRLRGRNATDSVLAFTVQNSDAEKFVVELPLRPALFEAVQEFFDRHVGRGQNPNGLPGLSPLTKLLQVAHHVSSRIEASGTYQGSNPHARAIGDALGIAVLNNDEASACRIAGQLKHALVSRGAEPPEPTLFLDALAPAVQAAVAADHTELLDNILAHALPKDFRDAVPAGASLDRFGAAMLDLMEERGADEICAFLDNFPGPNTKLRLLNVSVDACVSGGSARAIDTCGIVVRTLLSSCAEAALYVNEAGIRLRAFDAALSGDWAGAERHLDDMPRWNRSDFLFGWLAGYAMGLQVRSDHELELGKASDHFHSFVYSGNEKFEQTAAQFCRGLVAASQGRNGEKSEPILARIAEQYSTLAATPEFMSARYVHQLVHASRYGNHGDVQACLRKLLKKASDLGDQGDELLMSMCREIFSDVTIRNITLRDTIAACIGRALRDPANGGKFENTRKFAGTLITQSGFSKQLLFGGPAFAASESGHQAGMARVTDARAFGRPSAVKSESLDRRLEKLKSAAKHQAAEWVGVLAEIPAHSTSLDKVAGVFAAAVARSDHWDAEELALLNQELYTALLRRVRSLR